MVFADEGRALAPLELLAATELGWVCPDVEGPSSLQDRTEKLRLITTVPALCFHGCPLAYLF